MAQPGIHGHRGHAGRQVGGERTQAKTRENHALRGGINDAPGAGLLFGTTRWHGNPEPGFGQATRKADPT